jgi:hypothetical protein
MSSKKTMKVFLGAVFDPLIIKGVFGGLLQPMGYLTSATIGADHGLQRVCCHVGVIIIVCVSVSLRSWLSFAGLHYHQWHEIQA